MRWPWVKFIPFPYRNRACVEEGRVYISFQLSYYKNSPNLNAKLYFWLLTPPETNTRGTLNLFWSHWLLGSSILMSRSLWSLNFDRNLSIIVIWQAYEIISRTFKLNDLNNDLWFPVNYNIMFKDSTFPNESYKTLWAL